MGTETTVAYTPGSGASVEVWSGAVGLQQIVREAPATAVAAPTSWTLSITGTTSTIAADVARRSVILWNSSSSATVYLRYDGTAPTTAAGGWHDQIPPGGRLFVEKELVTLAVSFIASAAVGTLEIATATSA
jgi:hypothetical protein